MKWIAAIFFVTLLVTSPVMAVDWVTNPANGHAYTLVSNNSSWQDAEDKAVALGGHLVTIRSQAEQDWVFNYVLNATSTANATVYGAWIGMYQLPGSTEPGGGWVWSSGESVIYTHWQNSTGEPNDYYGNSSENWAKMYVRQHDWDEIPSFWNDTLFYEPVRPDTVGIVEVVPEPSSLLALGGGMVSLISIIRKWPRR